MRCDRNEFPLIHFIISIIHESCGIQEIIYLSLISGIESNSFQFTNLIFNISCLLRATVLRVMIDSN